MVSQGHENLDRRRAALADACILVSGILMVMAAVWFGL